MFERFTDGAKNVMARSMALAEEERSPFIRRHHLLAAMLTDAQQRPEAMPALMLAEANVDLEAFRAQVMASLRASEEPASGEGGRSVYSSGVKKAMELGLREALSLGHNYIGCEHLLLAILRSADGPLAITLGATSLHYGTSREFLRTYGPHHKRRGFRGARRGPSDATFSAGRTKALDDAIVRAGRRAGFDRPTNTGDLLVGLLEGQDSHFRRLLTGIDLPSPSDVGTKADSLVADQVPDGVADPIRVDPRTGAMTVTDPELAAKLKDMPGEKIAEALRRLLEDKVPRRAESRRITFRSMQAGPPQPLHRSKLVLR
ncbi:MAG: Clp protease N-terminal domain-containing protein [Acidimicrobiales bacterium]|nr:Clp protease N-terminal domain-containing protein [Acidimicrobiales bacterium]